MSHFDWIDLPDDNYTLVLGYSSPRSEHLNKLIAEYNSLKKDAATILPSRIESLNEITQYLENWIETGLEKHDKPKHLRLLKDIAHRKLNYLVKLNHIFSHGLEKDEALTEYHTNCDQLLNKELVPITLNNQCFFSIQMREYWGNFWLETLDPCHRRLTPFYHQWQSAKRENPSLPHLFLWLETMHIPKYVPRVVYVEEHELAALELVVNEGLLFHGLEPASFDDPSERYLFAIDLDEKIYAGKESCGFSHSSFTQGKAVLGAGLLKIEKGVLKSVALESGHYLPTMKAGFQILRLFYEKGVNLQEKIQVIFFHDRNKYQTTIGVEDLISESMFISILENSQKKSCQEKV